MKQWVLQAKEKFDVVEVTPEELQSWEQVFSKQNGGTKRGQVKKSRPAPMLVGDKKEINTYLATCLGPQRFFAGFLVHAPDGVGVLLRTYCNATVTKGNNYGVVTLERDGSTHYIGTVKGRCSSIQVLEPLLRLQEHAFSQMKSFPIQSWIEAQHADVLHGEVNVASASSERPKRVLKPAQTPPPAARVASSPGTEIVGNRI